MTKQYNVRPILIDFCCISALRSRYFDILIFQALTKYGLNCVGRNLMVCLYIRLSMIHWQQVGATMVEVSIGLLFVHCFVILM